MGRLKGTPGYPGLPWTPENAKVNVVLHPDRLQHPLKWKKPAMIFVNSMSDLFHEEIPFHFIAEAWEVMRDAQQHTFQILTKRPERMKAFVEWMGESEDAPPIMRWPLPNVWLGVSIENRHFVYRADILRDTPAAVRTISAEPLLGPLVMAGGRNPKRVIWPDGYSGPQLNLEGIDWIKVGGESGPGHRPIQRRWVRDLRDAAKETGTAFFMKQWGGEYPKEGGDLLDGMQYHEWPAALNAPRAGDQESLL